MKRSILFVLLLLGTFALSVFAQSKKPEIFGYYSIEKAPRAFVDISEIHLAGNFGAKQKPPFYGLIRMNSKKAKDFRLLKPTLKGKNLTFSTKSVGGVSYTFSGTFTKLGDFPRERPEGEILLKGTLTKFKGKTKIAEARVSFSYSAGD